MKEFIEVGVADSHFHKVIEALAKAQGDFLEELFLKDCKIETEAEYGDFWQFLAALLFTRTLESVVVVVVVVVVV